jgi:putative tryptophan/tyrosine transport system substrate-binding protein
VILQSGPRDFSVLAWIRDEAGDPIYKIVQRGIKATSTARTRARAAGGDTMMDRRAFLATLGLLAAPLGANAQQAGRVPRIGWLTSSAIHAKNVEAFRAGMSALGHREFDLDLRAAEGRTERLPALVAELLALKVDVIVTDGGPAARAAKEGTATIPVVIGAAADLVQQRIVASLARPGGNVTGLAISTGPEMHGKRLDILREAVPSLQRVVAVWNPRNDAARRALPTLEQAGRALRIPIELIEARDAKTLEEILSSRTRRRAEALLLVTDAFFWSQRQQITDLALRHRLPAMFPETEFAVSGGLMGYGPNIANNFRRAADYVDKILRGAKPGDLPVEQPSKFDLAINLKTAKTLGLTIPPSLLARADQVIE